MPPFARSRIELGGALWVLLSLVALGFLPQLGGPGYDLALIAGILLPSSVGITAALLVAFHPEAEPRDALARGAELGLASALILLGVAALHGARTGFCDASEGFALLALGPCFGTVLGGIVGAGGGLIAARRRTRRGRIALAIALGLAGPLTGVLVSVVRFYTSPMVFAYDPFAGYFSGPLYDTVIGSLLPLVTYRIGTLGTIVALLAASHRRAKRDARSALVAALGALVSVGITLAGGELGHWSTPSSIAAALGRRLSVGRCDIVYSSAVPHADAERVGRECHAHLGQIERFFDTRGPERVTVWLFANDAEKGRLMGAQHTYIAKPWRSEVYVQAAGFPHPVLGHELAHVVSRSFGAGPFHVAGALGGLLPDPGRIEGVATAAAPDENEALTLEEWAAAMLRLGLLPPLRSLFQLGGFFGSNASRAYTAAGAFVRFLRAHAGAAAVRDWYGGAPLEQVAHASLDQLEANFRKELAAVPLSEAELRTARAKFERPAFFARRCPRVIDRKAGEAGAHLAGADLSGARELYRGVLALDPHDSGARLGLATCSARAGQFSDASARLSALQRAADAAPWAKLAAREAEADVLLRSGRVEAALERYVALARDLVDEDRLRTLDVKERAGQGLAREAILALLIGDEFGPSWDLAAPKLGEWSARDSADGLADYLLAKNLANHGRYRDAALYLDRALGRALPEPRVHDEALRLRLVVGCATLDTVSASYALTALKQRPLTAARREAITRLAERCQL